LQKAAVFLFTEIEWCLSSIRDRNEGESVVQVCARQGPVFPKLQVSRSKRIATQYTKEWSISRVINSDALCDVWADSRNAAAQASVTVPDRARHLNW